MTANTNLSVQTAIVKQVLSGDTIVVRGQPRDGPPPERTVCLSNITAGKLARRPGAGGSSVDTKDEPYAWEAREYLRKKLVGKEVCFTIEYKTPTGREYGSVYAGKDTSAENVAESLILEGLVEVRRQNLRSTDDGQHRLVQLEESARAAGKGKWGAPEEVAKHVRDIKWNLDNPNIFVDSLRQKPVDAVVEHVRDGSTVRLFVLPTFHYVTVMMSGIKSPMFKMEGDKSVADPFAEEARFFTEARLLNRDVQVVLEGVVNQNIMGTVLHPNGSISELLLKEGFARCADWSMGFVKQGADKLRAAEKAAKEARKRIWKDYKPPSSVDVKDKAFTAKVTEIVNGDALMVKLADGTAKKIFLSSIRSPKPLEAEGGEDGGKKREGGRARPRPLYDIPYMFEAREFMRKKLIGKKVNIAVDYVQPKSDNFPEKTCCTVTISDINVAEALVSKGLATVVRYRADDDRRSSQYDRLLAAEKQAEKKGVGVHNKKEQPLLKVADVAGDVGKAKQFLPFLQRAGRCEAVVEFVSSGSRTRCYIPKETCLVTFLISGIDCPKPSRPDPENPSNTIAGDAYGEQALEFTKDLVLQHEVEVEVESMDKGGNFIGWLFIDGTNLSVALVEAGLAKVHFTAERSHYFKLLNDAQERARSAKLNIWTNYEPAKEVPVEVLPTERVVNQKTVVVTEVCTDLHFYVQYTDSSAQLDSAMEQLRAELRDNPPVTGAYTPKKGDLCAAKFSDGEWYRAKVEKVDGKKVYVFYVDYGNREVSEAVRLAVLPPAFNMMPGQAHECALACTALPSDEDDVQAALETLCNDVLNRRCLGNVEYRRDGVDYVSLQLEDSREDVAQRLLSQGLLLAENRRDKHLAPLVSVYRKAQETAKSQRLNLWRYGDFTADDAPEFGM